MNNIDSSGRRIITAGLGGAAAGLYVGASIGIPGITTVVPSAIAGTFIGFAGGLLNQTIIESLGIGQQIEDAGKKVTGKIKEILANEPDPEKGQCHR